MDGIILLGNSLGSLAYGSQLTLTWSCFMACYQPQVVAPKWLQPYLVTTLIFSTVAFSIQQKQMRVAFIDNKGQPGDIDVGNPLDVVLFACFTANGWLSDGLVLYRYYVIYNRSMWAVAAPVSLFLGYMAVSIVLLVVSSNRSMLDPLCEHLGIAYWSTSVAINGILTLLIILRLLHVKHHVIRRERKSYTSIIALLVESAALYTTIALPFIITFARGDLVAWVFLAGLGYVQVSASILILQRVINRTAYGMHSSTSVPKHSPRRSSAAPRDVGAHEFTLTNVSIPTSVLDEFECDSDVQSGAKWIDRV